MNFVLLGNLLESYMQLKLEYEKRWSARLWMTAAEFKEVTGNPRLTEPPAGATESELEELYCGEA